MTTTAACALSPRRHGLKILVYLRTEEATQLRAQLKATNTITYAQLEHYELLLNTKVDVSGSDLSCGMYATYDPDAFFSESRLANVEPFDVAITLPTPEESTPRKRKGKRYAPNDENDPIAPFNTDLSDIDPLSQLEYRKALEYTRRKFTFEPNSRDSFIYCLGNQCYTRHIVEEDAATILATLSVYGRTQSNRQILQTLVTVLDTNGFRKRITSNGITEYAIVEYRPEEREENALRAQQAEEQRKMNFDE